METKTFEVPALYGDHHVTEVRRILLELEGVVEVYASSAFQVVEVMYDESKINDLQIALQLDEAGYLGEWTIPIEMGTAGQQPEQHKTRARHTATYETTKQTVSFAQKVNYQGRPLWPCPGMGPVKGEE
ncbi:MAG TPA: heavy-metal-associated domain-containing protein [Anaerolineales bacterium]|nr:heavy-metal-associated domain-containing protein [Anaerolineales bacterium]